MKPDQRVTYITSAVIFIQQLLVISIMLSINSFMGLLSLHLKDYLLLFFGSASMSALSVFKKDKMGFHLNKPMVVWGAFVAFYSILAIMVANPTIWGAMWYVIMIPFIADAVAKRPLYRKFDATQL